MGSNIFPITCMSNGDADESLNISFSSLTFVSTAKVGFKELYLKKIDSANQTSASNNRQKWRKVNPFGSIVTRSEEFVEPLPKKELAAAANKAKHYDDENEEGENEVLEEDESSSESEQEEIEEQEGNSGSSCKMFPPVNDREVILYLRSALNEINLLPVQEINLQEKYFTAIYYPYGNRKKKTKLFVAKFLNRLLTDVDGATSSVSLDRPFELAIGSPTVLSERPPHLGKGAGNFEAYDINSGPLKVTFIGRKKWDVPAYPNVVKAFNIVSKIDREEIYRQLYDLSAIPKKDLGT